MSRVHCDIGVDAYVMVASARCPTCNADARSVRGIEGNFVPFPVEVCVHCLRDGHLGKCSRCKSALIHWVQAPQDGAR